MSEALRDARDETGEVVGVEHLGDIVEVTVRLPHLAAHALPGQFAQVRCSDTLVPLLRRPFSVAWTDGDLVSFVLVAVGAGTRLLAALSTGDTLRVLGPLGTGFTVAAGSPALCISGGVGCAPFPLLVRALRRGGGPVTVVNGAATRGRLYPAARFRRDEGAVEVIEVTVDGSAGQRGLVTDVLRHLPLHGVAVYACGPNPMLAAVARFLDSGGEHPALAEVSLEAPMGCGYGTCLGCAIPINGDEAGTRWALCCRQGPVLAAGEVDWHALMALPPAHVA